MKTIDKETLVQVGFPDASCDDFLCKEIVLRDGRGALLWVHKETGHGILDSDYWEDKNYYSEEYRKEYGANLDTELTPSNHLEIYNELNDKQFETFSSHLTKDTKYLEIGCSFGGIIKRVNKHGVASCHGVEPNKTDANFTQQNNENVEIFNSMFEEAPLTEKNYDVVLSNQVLEHTVSPREFLRKCHNVLEKNGLLHIEVPNHDDALVSTYKNPGNLKFYYRNAHIHYFTKESLYLLCRECGFDGDVSSFLMYPFFNHAWWIQNNKPQSSAALALSKIVPTDGSSSAAQAINNFYKKVETEYEELINVHNLGDCLIFQGKKMC